MGNTPHAPAPVTWQDLNGLMDLCRQTDAAKAQELARMVPKQVGDVRSRFGLWPNVRKWTVQEAINRKQDVRLSRLDDRRMSELLVIFL